MDISTVNLSCSMFVFVTIFSFYSQLIVNRDIEISLLTIPKLFAETALSCLTMTIENGSVTFFAIRYFLLFWGISKS